MRRVYILKCVCVLTRSYYSFFVTSERIYTPPDRAYGTERPIYKRIFIILVRISDDVGGGGTRYFVYIEKTRGYERTIRFPSLYIYIENVSFRTTFIPYLLVVVCECFVPTEVV